MKIINDFVSINSKYVFFLIVYILLLFLFWREFFFNNDDRSICYLNFNDMNTWYHQYHTDFLEIFIQIFRDFEGLYFLWKLILYFLYFSRKVSSRMKSVSILESTGWSLAREVLVFAESWATTKLISKCHVKGLLTVIKLL